MYGIRSSPLGEIDDKNRSIFVPTSAYSLSFWSVKYVYASTFLVTEFLTVFGVCKRARALHGCPRLGFTPDPLCLGGGCWPISETGPPIVPAPAVIRSIPKVRS